MPSPQYDTVVIGGGFYGCCVLLERASTVMTRASFANQARVHHGYHYPRSILTGIRSRVNLPRFAQDFRECLDDSFQMYYAIAKNFSKVTAEHFALFCRRIGAPIEPAPESIKGLFNESLIDEVYAVPEMAFDAAKLKARMERDLAESGVELLCDTEVLRLARCDDGLTVTCRSAGTEWTTTGRRAFNCTYSRLNKLLVDSELPPVPLKHELTEIALVEVPPPLRHIGITVMCGPFFSTMPFPPRGIHSLSHVRYTPHGEWRDDGASGYVDPYAVLMKERRDTRFPHMVRDAQRYVPLLGDCRYVDSLWEVKTILPKNDEDDGRPILFIREAGYRDLSCVMGSKIDNVYDVLDLITP
jgi:glycine/D-amino acid oxidase-like deaminating enzyme